MIIFFSLVCLNPQEVEASENQKIEEILVLGLTRTEEKIVLNQLPFSEGDVWDEEYRKWTLRRLILLDIFAYDPLRVIVEPLDSGNYGVVVRAADPAFLYKDPVEFLIMNTINLFYRQVNLSLYNPLGTGNNFFLTGIWGAKRYIKSGVTGPLGAGKASFSGQLFDHDLQFYRDTGGELSLDYRNWISPALRLTGGLDYRTGELDGEKQVLFFPRGELLYDSNYTGEIRGGLGLPIAGDGTFFRLQGRVVGKLGSLIGVARGGIIIGDGAPLNYYFPLGGFGRLPLRGQPLTLVQNYVTATVEYHWQAGGFIPILFADGGWYSPGGNEGVLNIGLGLATETPLGVIRGDLGWNPILGTTGFNIGLGHSY